MDEMEKKQVCNAPGVIVPICGRFFRAGRTASSKIALAPEYTQNRRLMTCLTPRIILVTLNARYIHASLGLRYLLANLDVHGGAGLRAQTVLREYTINRAPAEVVADLLDTLGPAPATPYDKRQIVGFGVYIWNVMQTLEVLRLLKAARPDVKVVLGGPEVSHEVDQQPITLLADHVITGWGDVSFAKLCRALLDGPQPLMKVIPGEQPALQQAMADAAMALLADAAPESGR